MWKTILPLMVVIAWNLCVAQPTTIPSAGQSFAGPRIAGTVVTADARPAANAKVTLTLSDHSAAVTDSVTTDDEGNYGIPTAGLPRQGGTYSITATADGQAACTPPFFVPPELGFSWSKPLQLAAVGSISGVVVDKDGGPAAHVAIAYQQPAEPVPGSGYARTMEGRETIDSSAIFLGGKPAGTTDANGSFTIKDLPAGKFVVTASLDPGQGTNAWIGSRQPITVKAGAEAVMSEPIRLVQSGSLTGVVVDRSGRPAVDVLVTTIYLRAGVPMPGVRTDASGAFMVTNLPPGTHILLNANGSGTIGATNFDIQEGIETRLPKPVILRPQARGGGGANG